MSAHYFFLSHPTPIFGTQLLFLLLGLALSGDSVPKRDMDGPFFFLGKEDHVWNYYLYITREYCEAILANSYFLFLTEVLPGWSDMAAGSFRKGKNLVPYFSNKIVWSQRMRLGRTLLTTHSWLLLVSDYLGLVLSSWMDSSRRILVLTGQLTRYHFNKFAHHATCDG